MSNRLKIQFAVFLLCFSNWAFAGQRTYQVELIAFQQQAANSEVFSEQGVTASPVARYARTGKGNKSLNHMYSNLKSAKNLRPFYYQSWRISVASGSISLPINISLAGQDLAGWIKVQRGELLHVIADIEFTPSSGEKYRLNEKRRVLLNDVHYLDHPKFGVIIKVSPTG